MSHIDHTEIVRATLWIPPTSPALETINDLMQKARQTFGGPVFKPHVTLASGIETTIADAEVKLKKLALAVTPFTVELGRIEWRDEYFRALFLTVALSAALGGAKAEAHTAFQINPPEPYEPHLSLAYGKLENGAREQFAENVGNPDLYFTAEKVQLVNAVQGVPAQEWQVLAERKFEG